jgi:hypothetical protein
VLLVRGERKRWAWYYVGRETIPPSGIGDPNAAGPWLEHVHAIFPEDAAHIMSWLAQRVQLPAEKINHALVLGGAQGIGKDSLLEPVKYAVGPWNFQEVSPTHLLVRKYRASEPEYGCWRLVQSSRR